ncbi:g7692 [Coccomyxa elongata]
MTKPGGSGGDIESPTVPDAKVLADETDKKLELEPKAKGPGADQGQAPTTGSLDVESGAAAPAAAVAHNVTYKDLFLRFVWMGWVAFGGPTAHIALFQKCSQW